MSQKSNSEKKHQKIHDLRRKQKQSQQLWTKEEKRAFRIAMGKERRNLKSSI